MDEHVIPTYLRAPEVFVDGRGASLRTAGGATFLDFLGGIAVSALGHGHARLSAALAEQAGRLLHVSNLFRHEYTEQVAGKLANHTGMAAVFFTNSGAEANEAALKLARKLHWSRGTPRPKFVALHGGFHGRTLGALGVTAGERYREPFAPLAETTFVEPGDTPALEAALTTRDAAALILEPIQGEGGIVELPAAFLRSARELCDATDTVLICDEVQCGTGRTGRFLCSQHAGIVPDVVTLAKPLAAGVPIGAMLARDGLDRVLVPGDHGSTFAGGPLALRAALVVLEELENGLLDAVVTRGRQLRDGLDALHAEFPDTITEVRGRGLMLGLTVVNDSGADLQRDLYARGLITNCTAGNVIRYLPPFVVTEAEIDRALDITRDALAATTASATTAE